MKNYRKLKLLFFKEAWLVLGFFFIVCPCLIGQNKKVADSLEALYVEGNYAPKDELLLLQQLARQHPDPEMSLQFSEQLLLRAQLMDSFDFVIRAYLQKGNALRLKGDVSNALQTYFKGVEIANQKEQNRSLGLLYTSIADVYSIMGNRRNTIAYYKNALAILKDEKDPLNYASVLMNLGDEYNLNFAQPDSALILFKQSGDIFRAMDHKPGIAYNLGNIGLAYAQKGENDTAEKNISKAINMLNELGDYYPICVYLTYMSDIYAEKDDMKSAFVYAERSLKLAKRYGLKEQISDANRKLSELYENSGDANKALLYYKVHIAFKDSVKNITAVQQMAGFEMGKKQVEVDLLNAQKKTQEIIAIATTVALLLIGLLAFGLFRRNLFIRKTKQIIEKERDRSEKLLLNILPAETALELKEKGKVQAKKFESVTVLFTDFKGFTHYAENLAPEKLVESVDYYFSKFDAIMEKHGLEKIKTVGDAYMCAGGLPYPTKDHAHKMVVAAFEIAAFVDASKKNQADDETRFDIRIGINTGPVVAGVVGTQKFSYDIWGDTVNVASRMETMSEAGKINISENTYDLIKEDFEFEQRGEIYVKNRGMMKMYYVKKPSTVSA